MAASALDDVDVVAVMAAAHTSTVPSLIDTLPVELFTRILLLLPLNSLVACRKVCVHWRAMVKAVERRDRRFRYACGEPDMAVVFRAIEAAHGGRPGRREVFFFDCFTRWLPCTCGVTVSHDRSCEWLDELSREKERNGSNGPPRGVSSVDAMWLPYSVGHEDNLLPPARWEQLRAPRDLAMTLALACAQVVPQAVLHGVMGGFHNGWYPVFVYLQPDVLRPTDERDMFELAHACLNTAARDDPYVAQDVASIRKFNLIQWRRWRPEPNGAYELAPQGMTDAEVLPVDCDDVIALSFGNVVAWLDIWKDESRYQTARQTTPVDPVAMRDLEREFSKLFPEYTFGREYALNFFPVTQCQRWLLWRWRVRREAAMWFFAIASGTADKFFDGIVAREPYNRFMNDHGRMSRHFRGQVEAVDRVCALFAEHCTLPIIVEIKNEEECASLQYVLGLSPGGHLVGAATASADAQN